MITDDKPDEEIPTLTDEQRARMEEWLRAHPYGDQDANGIDLSLIRENLKITPAERLAQLQHAHNAFTKVTNERITN